MAEKVKRVRRQDDPVWTCCDYPTEAALRRIRKWDGMDADTCLDFVASIWHWPDFGVSRELRPNEAEIVHAREGDKFLRLATGGWSGNESLIGALERNLLVSTFTWQLAASGGLHIYKYAGLRKSDAAGAGAVSPPRRQE